MPPLTWPFRAAVLLALVLAAAACTAAGAAGPSVATLDDPSASPSGSAGPQASQDPQQAFLDFAACMREHGVDMPDPQFDGGADRGGVSMAIGGNGADKEKLQKADEACRHFLANVALGNGKGSIDPETQDALLKFSACMREHGIDMPDPQFDTSGGGAVMIGGKESGAGFDPASAESRAADEACRSLLPGGGKGGAMGPTGPNGAAPAPGSESGPGSDSKGPAIEVRP